ncbi:MAG: tRNA (N6-isopentenyl adenosine(37)-C2)-methylthiotransferase MiaB [Acidobacteriota bacterium]
MKLQTFFVETWGCQMNVLDSKHLSGILKARGLAPVAAVEEADLALLNTCAVREKAVLKVLSRLGELRAARQRGGRPRVVGLCGCVGEQEGAGMLSRIPALSFILGPGRMAQLGGALDAVAAGDRPALTGFGASFEYDHELIDRGPEARQLVTVIHGCNQRCTFCVVPNTRGREASRPLNKVVREVAALARAGAREVTLLGQTVNAYRCPETGADFGDLLGGVTAIGGLWKVQFVTSHPRFFTAQIIERMSQLPRLGSYLHLPFQAGSEAILKRMRRGYTRAEFLEVVGRLREAIPGVTLSTDVIVGFPGETEADFEQTLTLIEEVRFGQLYGFVFSPRPRTVAARYTDRVPPDEARDRLERLFSLQDAIQLDINRRLIGSRVEVLADGPAKRGVGIWQGRGSDNRVVNFPRSGGIRAGDLAMLTITGATAHALLGECQPPVEAGLPA